MKTRLIAALLVAVSATVAAPAFSSESTVTRAQVRAELAQLQQAGYPLNRATDATYLAPIGIPTYGVPGIAGDPDGNGTHGLNERIGVASIYAGRDFLYDLVRDYAGVRR